MNERTQIRGFLHSEGGAGKTTLTVTMASYLYYCMGLKIIVVDCDYPQYSINDMREREKMLLELSPSFKRLSLTPCSAQSSSHFLFLYALQKRQ